tara:strand:- start:553 stop:1164 length:612 start_codon:yes stop_codon:yes gene_type:complete
MKNLLKTLKPIQLSKLSQKMVALLIVALCGTNAVVAQPDHYYTVAGTIMIQGGLNGTPVQAKSNKVTVLIDYNTGEFQLYFDAATLHTGMPIIDTLLAKQRGNLIQYEGNFGLDHVQTESHPPLDFIVEGYINCKYHNDFIQGKGRLEHLYDGTYSCYLNLSFDLTLDQLPFNINIEGLDENIRIEIIQMVLNQNSGGSHSNY